MRPSRTARRTASSHGTDVTITRGPEGPRLHIPIHLRWGDLDALGHVNNASMFRLLEEARLRAFWVPEGGADGPPTAVIETELLGTADTMAVIARQEIEYLLPVPYGQLPLDVQIWIGHLGGSSVEVCYEVRSPWSGEDAPESTQLLYARASAVMVMVDSASVSPRRLRPAERAAWQAIIGEPIAFGKRR